MSVRGPESATYEYEYIMDVDEHTMKFLPIINRSRGTWVHKSTVMNPSSVLGESKEYWTSMYKKLYQWWVDLGKVENPQSLGHEAQAWWDKATKYGS